MLVDWIVTHQPPHTPDRKAKVYTPSVGRATGSGWVSVLGVMPTALDAEAAIEFGHRLVEAGLAARVKKEVSNS